MSTTPNTVLDAVTSYPVFQPNQVLNDDDLQNVVKYFDQQTRLTRLCLIGSGIVCGLLPSWNNSELIISAGCGVTSEGFLIHLDQCRLKHFVRRHLSRSVFLGQNSDQDDLIDVWELFEEPQTNGSEQLTESLLFPPAPELRKVVVLWLETKDETNKTCVDDCDETGTQRKFTIRKLLMEHKVAVEILKKNYQTQDLGRVMIGKYGLDDLYLERFGYTPEADGQPALAKLTSITNYDIFRQRYDAIIKGADGVANRITEAFKKAEAMFSPIFSSYVPSASLPPLKIDKFDPKHPGIQYVYDHLSDLILAYDEFRTVAFDLMDVCGSGADWFPAHLFLGQPSRDVAELPIPPAIDRTPYFQPPIYNDNRARVDAARLLFRRLEVLINNFVVPPVAVDITESIKILPSKYGDSPFSARAIPYYYQRDSDLPECWNSDRHRKAKHRRVHWYHRPPASGPQNADPPFDDPLVFDFEAHNFFRIEGHIGLETTKVLERIRELRESYNLPFDIVALKLGEDEPTVEHDKHDCEIEILEAQYTKLRTDLMCAIDDGPLKELLKKATTLDTFEYKKFEDVFGEEQCHRGYDKQAFKELDELHAKRKDKVLPLHLFHGFAKQHPGLEHKAGVPRGGTFVLVYHDRKITEEERAADLDLILDRIGRDVSDEVRRELGERLLSRRTQEVVGDFCLPYQCCSDCPPTAFVLSRPRPTLLLESTSFCANDTTRYRFIVSPPGGVITGKGTSQSDGNYFFVPSATGIEEGPVEVSYEADNAEATLVITILPVPQATFSVQSPICPDADPVPLVLAVGSLAGGDFTTDIDSEDPMKGIKLEASGEAFFDPKEDPREKPTNVAITYTVQHPNGCSGTATQTTVVTAPPNAGFSGLRDDYCSDGDPSELVPEDNSVTSQFSGNGVIERTFDPRRVDFGDRHQIEVMVNHRVTDRHGCTAESAQVATVYRTPMDAAFAIRPLPPDEVFFNFHITDIQPAQTADRAYHYAFEFEGQSVLQEDSADFVQQIRKTVIPEGQELLNVTLVVSNGPCEGEPVARQSEILRRAIENPLREPVDLNDDVLAILESRRERSLEEIARIAEQHDEIAGTHSYGLVEAMAHSELERPSEDVVADFSEVVRVIVPVYKRPNVDKDAYRALVQQATLLLLDGLASHPTDDPTLHAGLKQLVKVRETDLNLSTISQSWGAVELGNALGAARVEGLQSLLNQLEG